MIISNVHKYVNISIPKTGTISMRYWLTKYFEGKAVSEHHNWDWRPFVNGGSYLIFTVVRNPYARCYSLWKWEMKTGHAGGMLVDQSCSFEHFLLLLKTKPQMYFSKDTSPDIYINQSDFVYKSGASEVLKLENLPDELKSLPFAHGKEHRFPYFNPHSNIKEPYSDYYNEETEALVWDYCQDDFERFGYERMVLND